MKKTDNLVSIIMPLYNSEKFITYTIESVLKQTMTNWELLIVNDCSNDNSLKILKKFKDKRIKIVSFEKNMGAAIARNKALEIAKGRFIAYLDADDLWNSNKLSKQIEFMIQNNYAFTCTDYARINENGIYLKNVKIPKIVDYNLFLRNTIIQTVGVIVDVTKTGKDLLIMPNIKRRQDAATWSQLLKNGYKCYGVPYVLSYYRVVKNSLSRNKFKAMKMNWYWYRKIENLTLFKTLYCFLGYGFNAIKKRL